MNSWLNNVQSRLFTSLLPPVCSLCGDRGQHDVGRLRDLCPACQQALPAAGALELIHNFSLVHDDIQDGSHYRRGRRAVWDIWGTAHGINVGDGLFVLARLALHRLRARGVPLERCQAATLAFDEACLSLCEGQFFDMTFEERLDVDLDQYLWMILHKTAALLAAAMQMGATLDTDDADLIEHLRSFAILKALGATDWKIWRVVLEQAVIQTVVSFGLGLAGSLALNYAIETMSGIRALFPIPALAASLVVMVLLAVLGSLLSIRRALAVDPMLVFRA